MPSLFDLDPATAEETLGARYRVKQLFEGLFEKALPVTEITNLPLRLRAQLDNDYPLSLSEVTMTTSDDMATRKWLYEIDGGYRIETVLMEYPHRATACISTQAGCAMACSFCATGQGGFGRQLTTAEIVEQVYRAKQAALPRRLSNIVMMGMGEPLANYRSLMGALRVIVDRFGISPRRITVSTVGVVPGIKRLATEGLPLTLAVSLHAANDHDRSEIIPLNRRYPIEQIVASCEEWTAATSRLVSLEWAMIADFNDTQRAADELGTIARRLRAHVNLIPLNPTPGYLVRGSTRDRVLAFQRTLQANDVRCTIRSTRGQTIDAACGQLAMRTEPMTIRRRSNPRLTACTTSSNEDRSQPIERQQGVSR
ncbi:MAG: 23S rRNA (adenine(2503)-C(2))-methyltransferase RlmN [Ferrimicrobium sp.]|uniref:23S rRNA (adenine(2503)-C(2))-methyltransferase RlmN n=1 Tax=Ferrimicrobium sp. TaxID=2926050 RepID=UPI002614E48B|nr:23S rRNA (adenine(2503)-C(2))-methyltransferase RlmN [Ferrimicrobium sp.]